MKAGTEVAEVADLSTMRARIYIPEFSVRDVRLGAPARLHAESQFRPWSGTLVSLAPASSLIEAGLIEKAQLEGIRAPRFYVGKRGVAKPGRSARGNEGKRQNTRSAVEVRPSLPGALPETLWAAVYGEPHARFQPSRGQMKRGRNLLQPPCGARTRQRPEKSHNLTLSREPQP